MSCLQERCEQQLFLMVCEVGNPSSPRRGVHGRGVPLTIRRVSCLGRRLTFSHLEPHFLDEFPQRVNEARYRLVWKTQDRAGVQWWTPCSTATSKSERIVAMSTESESRSSMQRRKSPGWKLPHCQDNRSKSIPESISNKLWSIYCKHLCLEWLHGVFRSRAVRSAPAFQRRLYKTNTANIWRS